MRRAAISTEAASAACQSVLEVSATAVGCVPGAAEGNTASDTRAAAVIGSAPGIRVVFFVAATGIVTFSTVGVGPVLCIRRFVPPPQPARTAHSSARTATDGGLQRMVTRRIFTRRKVPSASLETRGDDEWPARRFGGVNEQQLRAASGARCEDGEEHRGVVVIVWSWFETR